MSNKEISELVRALDPAGGITDELDRRAEQDLGKILRTSRAGRRRRLAAVLVAGAAALAVILVQPWTSSSESGPGTAQAATPPLLKYVAATKAPADVQLHALARRVAALPDEPATGPVLQIKLRAWYLVSGDGPSVIEPQDTTYYVSGGRSRTDSQYSELTAVYWTDPLSSDPADLERQLRRDQGRSVGPLLSGIADLHKEAAPPPSVRAALLAVLAGQGGIRAEGTVTDRAGRPGVAFSLTSDDGGLPTRTTYIFDRRTGVLLDIEQMLTKTAGKLNVPIPSVISYEIYQSRDYVTEMPR